MSNNETVSTRIITIRMRIPALVLASCILLGILIWAFVLGIMVGRGQMSDELAALMPAPEEKIKITDKESNLPEQDDVASLIKSEDLTYQESLRQNQLAGKPTTETDPAKLAEAVRRDSNTARPTAEIKRSESPQANTVTNPPAHAGIQKYAYVYQVASYSKESQAKEMHSKLQAKGFNAQIETKVINNVSWFRVLLSFEGDENKVTAMQDMLKKDFKINSTLLRSKKSL